MNQLAVLRNLSTKCIQLSRPTISSVMFVRDKKTQKTFEGLTSIGFAADSSNGFGYDKDGNLVIVQPVEDKKQETGDSIEAQTQSILETWQQADMSGYLSNSGSDSSELD